MSESQSHSKSESQRIGLVDERVPGSTIDAVDKACLKWIKGKVT
jgi:hypothetical protein